MKNKTLSLLAALSLIVGCAPESELPTFSSVQITLDTGDTSRPTVAVSRTGDAIFWAWIRKDDDGWNVYASRVTEDGQDSTEPVRVNHIPGNANPHAQAPAQVEIGPEGYVYVAWTNSTYIPERRFPASDLLFSRSTDGGVTWSEERPVNSDAGGEPSGHTFHNMTTLADGTILISWIDSRERDNLGGSVPMESSASMNEDSPHTHEMQHESNLDASGQPVGSQIRIAASRDAGLTFVETAVADNSACPCCRTTMAVSKSGEVYLAWRHEFENGARDPVIARSDDGGLTFTDPTRVSDDNWVIEACPHAGPGLSVDDNGTVHVSWFTAAASGIGLFTARSNDGALSFEPKELLKADQPVSHTAHAQMAAGVSGIAVEQVSLRNIDVFASTDGVGGRTLVSTIPGKSPSFAGGGGVSAMSFEAQEGIVSVVWRSK